MLKHSKLLVFHCELGYICLNQDENEMLYIFRFSQMINSSWIFQKLFPRLNNLDLVAKTTTLHTDDLSKANQFWFVYSH